MLTWGTIEIQVIAVNDNPVISFIDTQPALFYDNQSLWEVGYLTTQEDTPLLIGGYINITDRDIETEYNDYIQFNRFVAFFPFFLASYITCRRTVLTSHHHSLIIIIIS